MVMEWYKAIVLVLRVMVVQAFTRSSPYTLGKDLYFFDLTIDSMLS